MQEHPPDEPRPDEQTLPVTDQQLDRLPIVGNNLDLPPSTPSVTLAIPNRSGEAERTFREALRRDAASQLGALIGWDKAAELERAQELREYRARVAYGNCDRFDPGA